MDDGEDVYGYRPGGLHPPHYGDASRYKDRSKARPRRFFDRVAARDCSLYKYVAVNIKESERSKLHTELGIHPQTSLQS